MDQVFIPAMAGVLPTLYIALIVEANLLRTRLERITWQAEEIVLRWARRHNLPDRPEEIAQDISNVDGGVMRQSIRFVRIWYIAASLPFIVGQATCMILLFLNTRSGSPQVKQADTPTPEWPHLTVLIAGLILAAMVALSPIVRVLAERMAAGQITSNATPIYLQPGSTGLGA